MKSFRVLLCTAALMSASFAHKAEAQTQFDQVMVGGKMVSEPGFYTEGIMTIPARSAAHDTFSRLVFDWPAHVSYKVDDSTKGILVVTFKKEALIDMTEVKIAPHTNFGEVKVISGMKDRLSVAISIPKDAKHKIYSLGNKLVIDVDDLPGQKRGAFKKIPIPENVSEENAPAKAADTITRPLTPVSNAPAQEYTENTPSTQPITLTWTSTKIFNVAAFTKNNYIYLITDRADISFAPRVISTNPLSQDVNIKRLASDAGQIYRLSLPRGVPAPVLSSAGARMSWDFTIYPTTPQLATNASFTFQGDTDPPVFDIKMPLPGTMIEFTDPDTGERYITLPASAARHHVPRIVKTPDFELLSTAAGIALRSFNDTIGITLNEEHMYLALPRGTRYSEKAFDGKNPDIAEAIARHRETPEAPAKGGKRILHFNRWIAGLPEQYSLARQELDRELMLTPDDKKTEMMIDMARFELAYGHGPEALGYLDIALARAPSLQKEPEFLSLRGVALAIMGDSTNALPDLSVRAQDSIAEINMWRAYVHALNYDWSAAAQSLPQDLNALATYPPRIQSPLALSLAEILLRSNKPEAAEKILDNLEAALAHATEHEQAAINYLRGEAKRAQKNNVKAIALWNKAAKSNDQLFRVKAILAKTVLQMQERAITPAQAVETLERLRFAWRGDGLETQIAQVLGRLYILNKQWNDAFELMRGAAAFAQGTREGDAITAAMMQSFSQLFTNPPADLKPLEAIGLYDRFPELTPPGQEGKAVLRGLAKFLLQVDLLDRAAEVYLTLLPQDDNDVEVLNDGLQLAAIYLLDRDAPLALKVLDTNPVANAMGTAEQIRHRSLLRARALSDLERYPEAFDMLAKVSIGDDSLALLTDTAYKAGKWDVAARAVKTLFDRSKPDPAKLDNRQLDLLFSYAVAQKLAENEAALAQLRDTYLTAIKDNNRRRQLEVITRPANSSSLADRETLLNMMQEVDLFQSFLGGK